jgi:hypothetical protein
MEIVASSAVEFRLVCPDFATVLKMVVELDVFLSFVVT